MHSTSKRRKILYAGTHVRLVSRGNWEYAERTKATGIVGIVAITDSGKLLLVEQYRPPMDKRVIEIPAGLAGDIAGQESEDLATAARRELLEETGYEAKTMAYLGDGAASAGITDEIITLFYANKLTKIGEGLGDGSEDITVHEVPLGSVMRWLEGKRREGVLVDLKVYGALYFAVQKYKSPRAAGK